MDSLNTILNSGTYGENVSRHNDNNSKIKQAITTLENVAIANKGYFDTLASLQAAFPSPKAGNIAYVANVASSTGYYIYNVVSGVWTATTTEAPAVDVAISNYAQHGYSSSPKTLKQVDDEVVQLAGDIESIKTDFRTTRNLNPEWFEFGLTSGGGINSISSQSHTDYLEAYGGEKIIASQSIFRINLYKADQTFIEQSSFWGGTEFQLPFNSEIGLIRISSTTAYSSNTTTIVISRNNVIANTRRIENLESEVAQIGGNIVDFQTYIAPDNSTVIDFADYVVNGSVNRATGLIDLSTNRRSIEKYPIDDSKYYGVFNTIDTESGKKVAVFDETETLKRVIDVVDMEAWVFAPQAGDSFISITLISLYGEPNVGRLSEIRFFELTENSLAVTEINGIPIKSTDSVALDEHLSETNPHQITATLLNSITEIIYGGSAATKVGTFVTIDNSTPAKSGLMSKEDKAKLDGIAVSPITITGSGITKNASAFGFLPTATASDNVTALQNAVTGGGTILIDYPGTYLVNDTILLDSNTRIIFGANVFVSMQSPKRFLLNRGALTREYNENLSIEGLNLITNGYGVTAVITGLRGYIAFFYVKNLTINDFTLLDGASGPYVIHVCRFENLKINNPHIEGLKDAIHIGTGSKFSIKHGLFKTYDDPIALNAHDYTSGQPEYGWIEDGIIEDCYDLADPGAGTVGYFARILAGAWVDWYSGMSIQSTGDTVVASNGKMYKSNGPVNSTVYTSTIEPTHTSGTQTLADGITWTMMQENNVTYTAGVRRVTFRNIYLQKPRNTAFSIHFDKDDYSRSYYPNAESPIQEDLLFDGIFYNAEITKLINCVTPINTIKVVNSILGNTKIDLNNLGTTGIQYGSTRILLSNITFKGSGTQNLIESDIPSTVKVIGSIIEDNSYDPQFSGNVTLITNEL